jgi:hypothetical protein
MKSFKTFFAENEGGGAPVNVSANIAGTGGVGLGIDKSLPGTNQAEPPGAIKSKKALLKRKGVK